MSHKERCECVRHCKWVDEVVEDAPWVITEDFLVQYAIDFVAHDGDLYLCGSSDIYAVPKKLGKFLATQRTECISTSGLIGRVIGNVVGYKERNMKRGYSVSVEIA